MDWGGLILLLVVGWLVVDLVIPRRPNASHRWPRDLFGRRPPPPPPAPEPRPAMNEASVDGGLHRAVSLCRALTGDPARDRVVQNQVLSLGASVVPLVVQEHALLFKETDGTTPALVASFEETLSDFGLAVLPSVTAQLARLSPTSTVALSLLRVLSRLGPGGVAPTLRIGLATPQLAPYLPRWRQAALSRNPAGVLSQILRDRPGDGRLDDLDTLAGLLGEHPGVLKDLWGRFRDDARAREDLLTFQAAWLPLAQEGLVVAGLVDATAAVRMVAVRLSGLMGGPSLTAALLDRCAREPVPEVRAAIVRVLGQLSWAGRPDGMNGPQSASTLREALLKALVDPDPAVSIAARHALWVGAPSEPLPQAQISDAARAAHALLSAAEAGDVDALLAGLDAASPPDRLLAAKLLGRHAIADPRAKERLFRAADGRDAPLRATAVLALARAGEVEAHELLARQVREPAPPAVLSTLQEAAQVLGPAAAVPLARRVRNDASTRIETLLAVMRCIPYATAVPPLLRALEATRGTRAEGQIAATLAVGGPEVREALDVGLRQPGGGLLTPALAWLSAYATPDDLPVLMNLLERHPPLRGIVLGLIEAQGEAAREALRLRIPKGGEDTLLAAAEERLAMLDACARR